ncbi:energy transducer TonB [Lichenicoccus roseus]|uniref:Energy transducer TonB n=2 Tax=Lichenicoccus roseus TaxID=2683649 RepID=A0A5R9J394_9PROT|nr:energy transducer TonB [Lichenicoccus roseus]
MAALLPENPMLRRGVYVSGGLHLLVLLSLIVVLPVGKPPEPPEPPAVEMDFTGPPAASARADQANPSPQPPAPVPNPAPPSPTPPEHLPVEEAPPPPPPPPPVPPPPEVAPLTLPPLPTPPKLQAPSPDSVRAPPPVPSPPSPSQAPSPPSPSTLPALPQKMALPSHLTQPNPTRNAAADTHSLLATLEKFRADQKQTHAPAAHANPAQGGAPTRGRDITSSLSAGDQHAIAGSVRRCYAEDTEARNYAQFQAHLTVTVDATGEARMVQFSPADQGRMAADPSYRALAERARAAVMNPTCAKLPLPASQLGAVHQIKFVFRP